MKAPGLSSPGAQRLVTEAELIAWGGTFGAGIPPGRHLVALRGDLGSGKTTLAQAICAGYGVTETVTSPTFAIVHEYASPKSPVYHLDLFRLENPSELQNIGFDEIMGSVSLVIVEWPERAGRTMPASAVCIDLAFVDGDTSRRQLGLGAPFRDKR